MEDAARRNVVATAVYGNTVVRICDDYCRERTPEEVRDILGRIARRAMGAWEASDKSHEERQKESKGTGGAPVRNSPRSEHPDTVLRHTGEAGRPARRGARRGGSGNAGTDAGAGAALQRAAGR